MMTATTTSRSVTTGPTEARCFIPDPIDLDWPTCATHAAAEIRKARLGETSFTDPLTDIYNRRYFELRLDEEVNRHLRFRQPLSLVLVDVDHFKTLNDHFGHRAGDVVLREAAQLLMNQSRDFTTVTRYGGDEFAILLGNTPKPGALTYASGLKGVIEGYPFEHGPVTVSLGVATLPDDAATAKALFSAADVALHGARRLERTPSQPLTADAAPTRATATTA